MPTYISSNAASEALEIASARGLLPTALNTQGVKETIAAALRRGAVFSARTTNARYLQALKGRIERLLQGGKNNDWPKIRLELKQELQRLGYTPEKGFPGDAKLGIPSARPGSLRDLSSDLRLNLILDTQEKLLRGAAQKARGMDGSRLRQFPAWELVRVGVRKVPRGSGDGGSKGWPQRFSEAGGEIVGGRMIALKTDPVWSALGDSSVFSDALDTDHPPFAFNSGMGWREVHWTEAKALGLGQPDAPTTANAGRVIDPPRASAAGLDAASIDSLKEKIRGLEARGGELTIDSILGGAS